MCAGGCAVVRLYFSGQGAYKFFGMHCVMKCVYARGRGAVCMYGGHAHRLETKFQQHFLTHCPNWWSEIARFMPKLHVQERRHHVFSRVG